MLIFSLGLLCGILACIVGFWRHTCIFWEATFRSGKGPYNTPLGWAKPSIRYGTFVVVATLSVVFASCWMLLFMHHFNKWIAEASWGVWLMLRWMISATVAGVVNQRALAKLNWEQAEREAKRPRRSIQELLGVSMMDMSVEEMRDYHEYLKQQNPRGG